MNEVRLKANLALNPKNKVSLGQFMTPSVIADYMASLFTTDGKEVRLVDCGAGWFSCIFSSKGIKISGHY
jgi:adenine-specific DNA-methyltransferase